MKKEILHKISQIAIWSVFIATLLVFLGFSASQRSKVLCSEIVVDIIDTTGFYFVEPNDIIELLTEKGYKLKGKPIESLPLNSIESNIKNHPSVKNAEVYTTLDGKLHIDVQQRNPILRIINYNNEGYYVDNDGALFPLSNKYTARVLIANGNINEPYNLRYTRNASEAKETDELGRVFFIDDLYLLAKFIQGNDFYRSLVEQIYVNSDNEIEIVPKVGHFIILLGSVEDLNEKFENLKSFMQIALPREGWDKYSFINLKYKNQIVCTKKEGYEPNE
jgi:cell division protein FtsQ